MKIGRFLNRIIASLLILAFIAADVRVYAQGVIQLPAVGTRLALSPSFTPPLLKGIKVYRNDPFRFDFILDKGEASAMEGQVKHDSDRLIKYFLASLTIPEKDLWVNLSPYEKDRIVPEAFGTTEMGRDLLAQDYILKQITASVIYPEGEVGKQFWDKVYAEALKRYGTTDVPMDIFNKVWIIPEKATVYENKDAAFVTESKLKVMLEIDYLAMGNNVVGEGLVPSRDEMSRDVLREVVIPILEKEVNEGQSFAPLRQIYHSLILATWYKRKVKASIMGQAYVDQQKTGGIDIADKDEKEKIWVQYVEAFKQGAFNLIKEEHDPVTQGFVPRKYFSGGESFVDMSKVFKIDDRAILPNIPSGRAEVIQMEGELDQSESLRSSWDWDQVMLDQVDPEFDAWVQSGQMDKKDLEILKKILFGDENILQGLLKDLPGKVNVKAEDKMVPEKNGRAVYLRLTEPFAIRDGVITVLRVKGARPRYKNGSSGIDSHTGYGLVSRPLEVTPGGNVVIKGQVWMDWKTFQVDRTGLAPQGALLKERADLEYELMQAGQSGLGFKTDYPIAKGIWKGKDHVGRPVGFVIAGMRADDVRIGIDGWAKADDLLVDVVSDRVVPTTTEAGEQIYLKIGEAVRAYHDAGYFHGYPHRGNLGVELGKDLMDVVLRDLDTTIKRGSITGKNALRMEASYRFLDVQRIIADLRTERWKGKTEDVLADIAPLLRSFLKGYFPEIPMDSREFQRLILDVISEDFHFMVKTMKEGNEKLVLNRRTPVYGDLWKRLYRVLSEKSGDKAQDQSEKIDASLNVQLRVDPAVVRRVRALGKIKGLERIANNLSTEVERVMLDNGNLGPGWTPTDKLRSFVIRWNARLRGYGFDALSFMTHKEAMLQGGDVVNVGFYRENINEDDLALMRAASFGGKINLVVMNYVTAQRSDENGHSIVTGVPYLIFKEGKPVFIVDGRITPIHYLIGRERPAAASGVSKKDLEVPLPDHPKSGEYVDLKDITMMILEQGKVPVPRWKAIVTGEMPSSVMKRRADSKNVMMISNAHRSVRTRVADMLKGNGRRILVYMQMRDFLLKNGIERGVVKPVNGSRGRGVIFFDKKSLGQKAGEVWRMVRDGKSMLIQERIEPPYVVENGRIFDWNFRVFVPGVGDDVLPKLVRIDREGMAVNLSQGAEAVLFEDLVKDLGLADEEVRQMQEAVDDTTRRAFRVINEAMNEGVSSGKDVMDFMGVDIIVRREKGLFKAYVIELNDHYSGSAWDLDKLFIEAGKPERRGEAVKGWLQTMYARALAYKSSLDKSQSLEKEFEALFSSAVFEHIKARRPHDFKFLFGDTNKDENGDGEQGVMMFSDEAPYLRLDFEKAYQWARSKSPSELVEEMDARLKELGEREKLSLAPNEVISLRELFLHPTKGHQDLTHVLGHIAMKLQFGLIKDAQSYYEFLFALDALGKSDDLLFTQEDADENGAYFKYLSVDLVRDGKLKDPDIFLSFADLFVHQATGLGSKPARAAISARDLRASLDRPENKSVKGSVANYLAIVDHLKDALTDDGGEYFRELKLLREAMDMAGITPQQGGIDLDPGKMDLRTETSAGEISFNMDPLMLQRMQQASGVTPIIIGIQPLESVGRFMGIVQ